MGSPSARLSVRESLRTWIESGLEYVYLPGGLPAEDTLDSAGAQYARSPGTGGSVQSQERLQTAAVPPSKRPERSHVVTPAPQSVAAPPTPNFPAPWPSFFRFTKPEAKVVWTYMELGLDLSGQADVKRRAVLKNLQAHLRWPAGTINFWPVAALVDGALQPDTRMFWRGWECWKSPHIVCFGDEALRVILPDADPGLATHLMEHVIVHKLPPPLPVYHHASP